jgi:hypothetical protein
VTKAGLLFANDATIAGTFVASDDAAFPTWQGGTSATRGVFNQRSGGVAPAYAALGFSTSTLFEANIAAGSYGALTAVTTTDVGLQLNTKYYSGSAWRSGPSIELRNDASVSGAASASGYVQILTTNTTTTSSIWKWQSDGKLVVGASIFTMDVNLYRNAADTWKTDDAFIAASFSGVGTALTALNGSNISSGTVPAAFLGSGSSITTKYLRGDNTWQTISGGGDLLAANNLSDVASVSTSRTNLGVTATGADTTYSFRANNLSDLANASTARSNLGLGTIATQNANSVTISGGTISVTSLQTANFEAGITTAVDVKDANFRVYSGATQNARIDYTTGFYYVQGNQVVGARGTKGAAGLTEIVALLDAWGAWA